MVVVSDTGPLRYLILVDAADYLHALYGAVVIPNLVFAELNHPNGPEKVRAWCSKPPDWLQVVNLAQQERKLARHAGEKQVVALAWDIAADLILMDDAEGRVAAANVPGAVITGTVGVLYKISERSDVPFSEFIERPRETNFRFSRSLEAAIATMIKI